MWNETIPGEIKSELSRLVDALKKDHDIHVSETGWGFTAYPMGNEDGTYDVGDTAYYYTVDYDEDGYWYILEQHKGMLPGCFWTDSEECFWGYCG